MRPSASTAAARTSSCASSSAPSSASTLDGSRTSPSARAAAARNPPSAIVERRCPPVDEAERAGGIAQTRNDLAGCQSERRQQEISKDAAMPPGRVDESLDSLRRRRRGQQRVDERAIARDDPLPPEEAELVESAPDDQTEERDEEGDRQRAQGQHHEVAGTKEPGRHAGVRLLETWFIALPPIRERSLDEARDSCEQFLRVERLRHEIIGAKAERPDHVLFAAAGREHDDARTRFTQIAQSGEHVEARHARHHQIEHQHVGPLGPDFFERPDCRRTPEPADSPRTRDARLRFA